jgi:Histidine kinase
LTPVLALGVVGALSAVQRESEAQRAQLLFAAELSTDRIERTLARSESLLMTFADEISSGDCAGVYTKIAAVVTEVANVVHFDTEGVATCSAVGEPGFAMHNPEWLAAVQARPGVFRSETFFGNVSREWLFAIFYQARDADGAFNGAVSFGLRATSLASLIAPGRDGAPIDHGILGPTGEVFGSERYETIPESWLSDVRQAGQSRVFLDRTSRTEPVVAVLKPVAGTDIVVVLSQPVPPALNGVTIAPLATIGLPLLAFAGALAAVWISIDWLVLRWLGQLRSKVRAFGQGQAIGGLEEEFAEAPEEIADFARTMDTMIARLAERDRTLHAALAEKDNAIREVHHRVKNSLQIVTSLLRLQARRLDHPEAKSALCDAQARVNSLAIVQSRLDQDAGLPAFDLELLVRELCEQLTGLLEIPADALRIEPHAGTLHRPASEAVPIALWLAEVLIVLRRFTLDGSAITLASLDDAALLTVQAGNYPQADDALREAAALRLGYVRQLGGIEETGDAAGTLVLRLPQHST